MLNEEWNNPIGITIEQWIELLQDQDIMREKDIELLKLIYASDDFMATASQLAKRLNMPHFAPLNSQTGRLGKRIVKRLKIEAPKEKHGDGYDWWHVIFLGKSTKEGYYWILRPELKKAMERLYEVSLEDNFISPDEVDTDNIE